MTLPIYLSLIALVLASAALLLAVVLWRALLSLLPGLSDAVLGGRLGAAARIAARLVGEPSDGAVDTAGGAALNDMAIAPAARGTPRDEPQPAPPRPGDDGQGGPSDEEAGDSSASAAGPLAPPVSAAPDAIEFPAPSRHERWRPAAALGRLRTGLGQAGEAARWASSPLFGRLGWLLFTLALAVYAITRLYALDKFPIYFFTDEAFHPLHAAELLRNGFKNNAGQLFPIYYEAAASRWTPVFAIYVHAISLALFGMSITVTRATTGMVSLLGVAAVAIIARRVFKLRFWWAAVLLMAVMPAWFLHSRTGFETAMMSSFFAIFLLFYLLYRTERPMWLLAAAVFAAMTFYTYSNGQAVMAAAAGLLWLSDLRYHIRQWRAVLVAGLLGLVLAWPFLSFRADHPEAMTTHLRFIGSPLYAAKPPLERAKTLTQTYLKGLSPQYWFKPNNSQDLERHRMKNHAHIDPWEGILVVIGFAVCLAKAYRSPPHRAIILAALAAPVGAALVDIGITRVLAFVIPAGIMATLGLDWLARRILAWRPALERPLAWSLFAVLAAGSLLLLRSAVADAPYWYSDYGLYGQQWGAQKLFTDVIPRLLSADETTQVIVSPQWSNGTEQFGPFFLTPAQSARTTIGAIDGLLINKGNLTPNQLRIITPGELKAAQNSGKFKVIRPTETISYPDGTAGFYVTRLAYVDNVDDLFAADRDKRRALVTETMTLGTSPITVSHSVFDMGSAPNLFDGNPISVARGLEANPLIIAIAFGQPRPLQRIEATTSPMKLAWTIVVTPVEATVPLTYTQAFTNTPVGDMQVGQDIPPVTAAGLHLSFKNVEMGEPANIHVYELRLK